MKSVIQPANPHAKSVAWAVGPWSWPLLSVQTAGEGAGLTPPWGCLDLLLSMVALADTGAGGRTRDPAVCNYLVAASLASMIFVWKPRFVMGQLSLFVGPRIGLVFVTFAVAFEPKTMQISDGEFVAFWCFR